LHERYQREGIKIPFPIKTVYLPETSDGGGENNSLKLSDRRKGEWKMGNGEWGMGNGARNN